MKFSLSDKVLSQALGDELVLLDIESGRYFGMQSIGRRIWQLLSESCDSEEVLSALESEYSVEQATLRKDVAELLDSLMQAGLISVAADAQ